MDAESAAPQERGVVHFARKDVGRCAGCAYCEAEFGVRNAECPKIFWIFDPVSMNGTSFGSRLGGRDKFWIDLSRGDAEAQRISPAQRREEENLVSRLRGNDIFSACSAVSAV